MSDDVQREIERLKDGLRLLQDRLNMLERRVGSPSPSTRQPLPAPSVVPVAPAPKPVTATPTAASGQRNLEARIGRDWLNRIGITSLVLGVAFFILYTFQYLGPFAKLAVGYAIGGLLLGLGVWIERRPGFQWYGRGVIGGGWALVYFTTYAMHHIPAVRVLDSPLADLCLLLLVTVGAVGHSLKYRSETITASALLLGFITTSISDVTYFTLASSALLVAALVWLVVRLRWYRLYLYGVVASYVTYVLWISPQIHLSRIVAIHAASVVEAEFWLKAGFLSLYWIGYNGVLFALEERTSEARRALLAATLINALAFVQAALTGMDSVYHQFRYLVLLVIGGAYLGSVPAARRRTLSAVADVHLLLGLTLVTLAIPLKLSDQWSSFLWLMEVAPFVWVGLRYARWPYRVFAFGVALLMAARLLTTDLWETVPFVVGTWVITWRVLIGAVAVLSFSAAAACYGAPRFRSVLRAIEAQAFHSYFFLAGLFLWLLIALESHHHWSSAFWTMEAAATVFLGFRLRDRGLRLLGVIGASLAALWQCFLLLGDDVTQGAAMVVIGGLLVMGWQSRTKPSGANFTWEWIFRHIYDLAGVVLLTMLLWLEVDRHWLSIAWAIEGLALVGVGFALRDKVFRFAGLGVFGLLVLKILFVDLAAAETIYRILSFIVAGCILLAASYAYTRFSAKLESSPR